MHSSVKTSSYTSINVDDTQLLDDNANPVLDHDHRVLVAYSENSVFNAVNFANQCVPIEEQTSFTELMNKILELNNSDETLVMIAREQSAYPRHALYIVQSSKDLAVIPEIMKRNNEIGTWHSTHTLTTGLMIQNYNNQMNSCCDKGASVSYPTGFIMSASTQLAIFKLVYDLTDDIQIAFAVATVFAIGAMFYMKAAYSNNLLNQKRVEFNPGLPDAQSLYVNSVAIRDFATQFNPEKFFAIGAPVAAASISADVGLSFAKMGGNMWLGFAGVAANTLQDLLTSSVRACEQLRMINPIMRQAQQLPGLGIIYRTKPGQIIQKALVAGEPLVMSCVYGYAAYSLLKNMMTDPSRYVNVMMGIVGFTLSIATVPLYSIFELGAAERSLARAGNPIPQDSRLRLFQNMGKAMSDNARGSNVKKAIYTVSHSLAQGVTIGLASLELLEVYLQELTLAAKAAILAGGVGVSMLFALSKNKRVFEKVVVDVSKDVVESGERLTIN